MTPGHTLMCAFAGDTSRCVLTAAEARAVAHATELGAAGLPANLPSFAVDPYRASALAEVRARAEADGVVWARVLHHVRDAYAAALADAAESRRF